MTEKKSSSLHMGYLVTGIITVIPLWVTWLVFDFVFTQLSNVGTPWVQAFSKGIQNNYPAIARWLPGPWFQNIIAVLLMLAGLYFIGWLANRVIGRRLLNAFESVIQRLPMIQTVYRLVRQLISALRQQPGGVHRVVLIEFPSPAMKTVGFVTRTLVDTHTGRELAAVYVPTTPNPTSGYLEIVPVEHLISTDWTIDEAMNFIISGGAVAPDRIPYDKRIT